MIAPAIPDNEPQRLASLRQYDILDSLSELEYDNLTMIAAHICQSPISMITLVDSDRQWYKSCFGVELDEVPRAIGLCAHCILEPERPLIVNDLTKDARFVGNPFVAEDPQLRFYGGVPLLSEDGHALGTICVVDMEPRQLDDRQITALKALSQQVMVLLNQRLKNTRLERQHQQLLQSYKNLDEFTRIVSHDLRAPIRLIDQYVTVIEEDFPSLPAEVFDHLTTICNSAKNADMLVRGILSYSRSINQLTENVEPIHVNALLEELIRAEVDRDRFQIIMPENPDIWITTSRIALTQILQNLLSNAVKYHDKERGLLKIAYARKEKLHEFYVQDDGPGIPPAFQRSIFKLFQTVEQPDEVREQFGVGLSIVDKLTAALGGEVWVESEPGAGSTFYFTLATRQSQD